MIKDINNAREMALNWLESMSFELDNTKLYYNSDYNKQLKMTDMYLAGTYNGWHCGYLLGENCKNPEGLGNYLNSFQTESGAFRMPSMKLADMYHPTYEYDDFHITNYVLGLMDSLRIKAKYPLKFMAEYDSIKKLDQWLGKRDLANPWAEGNYIVNLASFYIYQWDRAKGLEKRKWKRLLQRLVDWHYYMQDSQSGYWLDQDKADLVSAMAGAAHNYHIFFYLGLPIRHYDKIIDHCLEILDGTTSACLDIDVVDVLVNLISYDYRVEDIKAYLHNKLECLLNSQNEDGGFYDVTEGVRVFDGWSVYKEPQGMSNAFATWFRMATIGMIASVLYPETRNQWKFRKTIGIGYFKEENCQRKIPKIIEKQKIRPSKHWLSKNSKTIDLSDDGSVQFNELVQMTLDVFNEKDLGIFTKPTTFAFKVQESDGLFKVYIDDGRARIADQRPEDILITINKKHLKKILEGKLMPVMAYGLKKLSVEGDITLALKLQNLL